MNQSQSLRRLFWIGWVVWFVLSAALLALLPSSLAFVTWTYGERVLSVTWSFLVSWVILFWVWPFVFRFAGSLRTLTKIVRGIQGTPKRLLNAMRTNPLFFITWAVLLVGWQVASYVAPAGTLEHPLVPGWDYVFRVALPRMAGDWYVPGGFPLPRVTLLFDQLAPFPAILGEEARTWPAVFLALAFHSFMTLSRLVLGLSIGLLGGLSTGLVISYWSVLRQISWTSMNFLRMIPLLAAIPWMQVALGATLRGLTTFIAFGVWVVLVVATMNSVANVPDRYIESARTLGASRLRTYFKVIIPGSMPELRTALLLSAGLGWSLTIAAEFLGFPTGLGYMASIAVQETNTARLVIVAIVVAVYSLLTFFFLNEMFKKLVSWMPQRTGQTDISKIAGAAGAARAETIHEV